MTLSKQALQKLLSQIIAHLPPKDRARLAETPQLNCVFVDQAKGRMLNHTFRGRDYATDVLSFAPIEPGQLGELVFCTPILKKQAKEHKLTPKNEFLYLFIHGLLHLLGYDHEKSDKAAEHMYRLQDSIFAEMTAKPANRGKKQGTKRNGSGHRTLRRKK